MNKNIFFAMKMLKLCVLGELIKKRPRTALCPCFFGRSAYRDYYGDSRLTISQSRWNSPKTRRHSTSWLKRNLLLIVVGTVEARDTSRDMDNVQMIGTKITAIKEYLYVRHPHCTSFITSAHLVRSTSTLSLYQIFLFNLI